MTGRGSPAMDASIAAALSKADQKALRTLVTESVREVVQEVLSSLNTQVNAIEKPVKELGNEVSQQRSKMEAMGTGLEKSKQAASSLQQQLRLQEQTISSLAWESSQKKLHLQDLTSKEGADLKETVIQILAPLADIPEEDLFYQIQAVYRMETQYIKRNGLEPEIHIKFKEKEIRDAILFAANKKPVEYAGKKVRILKDVPLIIRQKRSDFKPLAKQLLEKKITYRWLNPAGLQFKLRDQLFRLVSKFELENFLEKYEDDFKTDRAEGAIPKTKEKDKPKQEKEKYKKEA